MSDIGLVVTLLGVGLALAVFIAIVKESLDI